MKKMAKKRKKKNLEDLPLSPLKESLIEDLAKKLTTQINKKAFDKKYAPVKEVLKIVGAGVFLGAAILMPNLPLMIKPFISKENEFEIWRRFNIPYLKRTLRRLEIQKLVEFDEKDGLQIVRITDRGRRRILKYALDELEIKKPKVWDGQWRLVSYDIPAKYKSLTKVFREYLRVWKFYPLHESVYLHAYPCEKEIEFLRAYLGASEYVRLLIVTKIENDRLFRDFFGV